RYDEVNESRAKPLYLLKPDEVLPFLNGALTGLGEQKHEVCYIRYPSTAPNRLRVSVYSTTGWPAEQVAEILRDLFAPDLKMVWGGEPMSINQFSSRHNFVADRLGIKPCSDEGYYLMRGELAVRRFSREELTLDVLRAAAPKDTWLFSAEPVFFIQMKP